MAIQKISNIDKGSIQAVEGIAKTSIEAMDGITASFVTYDSIAALVGGDSDTLLGPESNASSTKGGYRPVIAYDTIEDLIIVGWQDLYGPNDTPSGLNEFRIKIGAMSADGSCSWGSMIQIHTSDRGQPLAMQYNPTTDKVMCVYNRQDNGDDYRTKGVSLAVASDKTVAADSEVQLIAGQMTYCSLAYDEDTASMYINYKYNNDCVVAQLTDGCASLNAFDSVPWASGTQVYPSITYAKSINRMLVACDDDGAGTANCGTMSSSDDAGQTVVWGHSNAGQVFLDAAVKYTSIAWDETVGKGVVVCQSGSKGKYNVFTVDPDSDANTITFPAAGAGEFDSSDVKGCSVMWNPNEGHFIIVWIDVGDSSRVKMRSLTVNSSNDTASLGTERIVTPAAGTREIHNFHTFQNHIKQVYLPDTAAKGSVFPITRDAYSDIDAYRLSAQGTDYSNDV